MANARYRLLPFFLFLACLLALPAGSPASGPAGAGGISSPAAFERLVVLENGRKMPMDSFARIRLLQFSGKSSYDRQPASAWLARVFFAPETARDDGIFLINHPQVVQALHLQTAPHRRYSYRQLEPSLAKLHDLSRTVFHMEEEKRSAVENEVLRVAHNLNTYRALRDSLRFTMPDPDLPLDHPRLREGLGFSDGVVPSLLDVILRMDHLPDLLSEAEGDEGAAEDLSEAAGALAAEVNRTMARYRDMPPSMIPVRAHTEDVWLSPWGALAVAGRVPGLIDQVVRLDKMAAAYRGGDQLAFNLEAKAFSAEVRVQATADRQMKHTDTERLYNRLDLFYRSEMLYGLTFIVGFASLISRKRRLRTAALVLLGLALVPHTAGILLRMNVMGRPPVTNLYSTFLFVAWIAALLCAVMEKVQKNSLGVMAGGLSGLALLLLSRRFISMSDPMGVLVAVLDSNFWLATHVVTITMGYAGCCLAGLIAHFYLLQALIDPRNSERLRSLYNAMFAVLGFGLTFSFLGTMLGGVWADQSWGRFWGWDPKENGALLIVLWCAILYHARLSRMIGDVGMAAGSILGIIVVLFAWLGVNLLGVGLHSYGFTSGVATGLFGYTVIQIIFVAIAAPIARRRLTRAAPSM